MRSLDAVLVHPARPGDTMWNAYIRRMMDPDQRLVLQWCAHLAFEDVMRIDHGSIHAADHDTNCELGTWRIAFGNGRLPATIVPASLVRLTQRLVVDRARAWSIVPRHDEPVFTEAYGEAITRGSLLEAIRRAIVLVRVSDAPYVENAPKPVTTKQPHRSAPRQPQANMEQHAKGSSCSSIES